jgi:hypothetical protein
MHQTLVSVILSRVSADISHVNEKTETLINKISWINGTPAQALRKRVVSGQLAIPRISRSHEDISVYNTLELSQVADTGSSCFWEPIIGVLIPGTPCSLFLGLLTTSHAI